MEIQVNADLTRIEVLYYAAKLIGLAPFTIRKNKFYPATLLGKAYAVVVAVLWAAWVFYFCYNKLSSTVMTTLHQIIFMSWGFVVICTVISAVFTFAIRSENILNLINQIIATDSKLRELLTTDGWCHEEIGNNWIKRIIKSNLAVFFLLILEGIFSPRKYTLKWNLTISIGFTLFTLYAHNIILIFVQILMRVKQHFEYLNKNLQDIFIRSNCDASFLSHELSDRPIFVVDSGPRTSNQRMPHGINEPRNLQSCVERIKNVEILHNELINLVELTARLFTMPIVFIIYQYFSKLIKLFYTTWINILLQPNGLENLDVTLPKSVCIICQSIITIYDMILITHACSSTYKAGNTTRSVLGRIVNKFRSVELKDEFVMFHFQLIHKPLAILIFGFFDLGYPCLMQMFTALISYVLVVIQLEPSLQN